MISSKKEILTNFTAFLESLREQDSGKCAFNLLNETTCKGWIDKVQKNTVIFLDSGPFASEEPLTIEIANINTDTLYYYESKNRKWVLF